MAERRIRLAGFEDELIGAIASGFRFQDQSVQDVILTVDRNIFAGEMPDPAEIATTADSTFDPLREPAIAVYRQVGQGVDPYGRLAFNTLIVLRAPRAIQVAVNLLSDLVVWLQFNAVGMVTPHYVVKGYKTLGMPVPAERLQDDKTKASASVRFLAIATS